ncbi:MAG TPA: dipeptide/oligopeptide/nickel ABC transporter ATP-binding protein [Terriglobales bacterium]|nr:dipeptide/oligopeptide/nickel ABC transporter ATP-binding protein [Terriglobales bacterium]
MQSDFSGREFGDNPLLRVQGLAKRYVRGGLLPRYAPVEAVRGVDVELLPARTLALVGASGSGKSTVARCVTRLERPDSGQIWFEGTDIARLSSRELLPFRPRIQMIFQDAATAMNPRFSAAEVIAEPLLIQGCSRPVRLEILQALMRDVALPSEWLNHPVMEFSGGQRQRLAIARALAVRPKLLVLDEALSGLDLSTQAQIANLLLHLQATYSLTFLLISHDLALVAQMADAVAVMAAGQIVEQGQTRQILASPTHEETKRLLACAKTAELNLTSSTVACV